MSSIYKVAELVGVSPKTAARILAGESSRSKHRDKVFEAAKQLGYVRNQQAVNLRSGSTSVIGIVVPDVDNPFYGKVVQSMHDACLKLGFSILLASSSVIQRRRLESCKLCRVYVWMGLCSMHLNAQLASRV
jgi:LacI family transcriptional regulator